MVRRERDVALTEAQRGALAEPAGRQGVAAFGEHRAQGGKAADMHAIGARAGAIGQRRGTADDRHRGILRRGVIERGAHLAGGQSGDAESAQRADAFLDHGDGHFGDAAISDRRDLARREADRARAGLLAAIATRIINETESGKCAQRVVVDSIVTGAKGDRRRRPGRNEQVARAGDQRLLRRCVMVAQREPAMPCPTVPCRRTRPTGMKLKLNFLPGV